VDVMSDVLLSVRLTGAVFFDVVAEAGLVLGIDLGARFLRGAICDLRGDVMDGSGKRFEIFRNSSGTHFELVASVPETISLVKTIL